jgi:hypothetical protein
LTVHFDSTEGALVPKARKGFRFNPQLYTNFKELASRNGYTVAAALEKFMASAVEFGLVFPSARNEAVEAEARVMLAWLKDGKYYTCHSMSASRLPLVLNWLCC